MILQTLDPSTASVLDALGRVTGIVLLAALVAALVALVYRWYVREVAPRGLPLLGGLSVVAVLLNTTSLLAREIDPGGAELEVLNALATVVTFVLCGLATQGGARVGDRAALDLFAGDDRADVDADVSEIVQTVGRVTSVRLPEEIDDVVGYDPVAEETKEALAGRRFLFPKRLSREEVRERLVARLKTDYGVGHADLELGEDGDVAYLAVGVRAAGIGPTLPPATNAVAVRADPALAASAGDLVQVWETDPARRVLTGELRGVAGSVVTVAIDAADTSKLDATTEYKLVTLPVQERPDREFASLLRAADETLATVAVGAGSELDGATVDSLGVTVAAVTRDDDGTVDPVPDPDRRLAPGDVVYAVGPPEALRRLEIAADARADADEADGPGVADDADATGAADQADGPGVADGRDPTAIDGDPDAATADEPTDRTSGPGPGRFPDPDEREVGVEDGDRDRNSAADAGRSTEVTGGRVVDEVSVENGDEGTEDAADGHAAVDGDRDVDTDAASATDGEERAAGADAADGGSDDPADGDATDGAESGDEESGGVEESGGEEPDGGDESDGDEPER